jgi:hypothetical protein
MFFGDSDRSGGPNQDAWKKCGLNIDHAFTTESSTDSCTLVSGASCAVQLDGNNGIDNAFGANVAPMLQFFAPGGEQGTAFSATANGAIERGAGTMLVRLDGVGNAASYAPLAGALYRAVPTSSPPKWDGTDVRDVDDASVVSADITQPLAAFPAGYMNERTWVGAPAASVAYLDVPVLATMPPLRIRHVQVLINVAPDNATAQGVLSGLIPEADLVAWFRLMAGAISTSLCSESAFHSIAAQVEQTSDILDDGTNVAGKSCNAISIGLGFDAVAVQLGRAQSVPPPIDPCADGG